MIGSILGLPFDLALKAEALHLANRTPTLLKIRGAEALVERSEERWWSAELHRLRGVFLAAMGVEESQIAASFCEAIGIAKAQNSISMAARAEATYAEYRRQKVGNQNIIKNWVAVILMAVPVLTQVYFNSSLAYGLMRLCQVGIIRQRRER